MRLWSRLRASEPAEPATVVRSALLRVSRGYFFGYIQNISEQNKDISVLISLQILESSALLRASYYTTYISANISLHPHSLQI